MTALWSEDAVGFMGSGMLAIHMQPVEMRYVVHPLEERDLGQSNNLRGVGGGGDGVPGRRHCIKYL